VRNEVLSITSCLDDLALQDYPRDCFEIIVSDDFSEDYTAEKVRNWANEHPGLKLTLLQAGQNIRENHGKSKPSKELLTLPGRDHHLHGCRYSSP